MRTAGLLGAAMVGLTLLCACADARGPKLAPVVAASPCADFSFPIYFERGSEQLTPAARQILAQAGARVRGCTLGPLDVLGLADAGGGRERNLAIAQRRAEVVAAALKASGLPAAKFDIEAMGAEGARAPRGGREPLRRRTEVVIRASPPETAARG